MLVCRVQEPQARDCFAAPRPPRNGSAESARWPFQNRGFLATLTCKRGVNGMQFGLFGSATARHGGPDVDSGQGYRQFVDYNVEAEALGYHSTFLVEHHFTGFGQVSASLSLLTWVAAKTKTLRLGTAVLVLPWHNPVLLAEQAATIDLLSN